MTIDCQALIYTKDFFWEWSWPLIAKHLAVPRSLVGTVVAIDCQALSCTKDLFLGMVMAIHYIHISL